ncbi:MAG: YbjN domain-containing protein [Corynebacterium sp.]|nr:YbjN domain-containing protein [Corynebacterium sp.]MDO5031429.1 YbjN domain-containing protein [Corynebacterium sp.]
MDYARFGPHDLLFPHPPLGETRVSMDPKGEPVLRFYTTHHGLLGFGEIPDLSEFVNDWNHDCLSPRLVLNYASPEEVEVWGHTFLVVHHTPTAAQLEASVLPALSNAQAFLEALVDYFPLLTQVKRGSALLAAEEESAEDTASTVLPVDVPRLEKLLPALGIIRFQSDSDEVVYAWINDVLFAFVIESGPSLLIKGHWDPDFPGSEFSKIFLICNDWNRKNHSASAFCHSNMDGLQVRLDYPVITAAGLSDAQLVTALGRSIKHILHGIDDIATEAVGSSPVQWP